MKRKRKRYVFGPVASRRLGRSLGVDLVPPKTCCYDCIYCQLGRTTNKTIRRAEYVPTREVIRQVHERLAQKALPDYITLSGSGEPTLHSRMGEIIEVLKKQFNLPVAVLTNGALFSDPQVRRECAAADIVMPSLDAGDEALFQYVNRPVPGLPFSSLVEGLIAFRREFGGSLWLEVFLLAGVTDFPSEVEKIRAWVNRIAPDRIQLNTAVRPSAEAFAFRVSEARMAELAAMLGPGAEVIADYSKAVHVTNATANREDILAFLARRPSSIAEIAEGLGAGCAEVGKCVSSLYANGELRAVRADRDLLFALAVPEPMRS